MKLLFDQSLSHRLPERLADIFPGWTQVRKLGLDRASDSDIWAYAKAGQFCIVSQDADFAERSRLFGAPPKVVWLHCGNRTPREIEHILRRNFTLIADLQEDDELHFIELQ